MLSHDTLATPAPSSECDVPSSPVRHGKEAPLAPVGVATPPPSSPTAKAHDAPPPAGLSPTKPVRHTPLARYTPAFTRAIASAGDVVPLDYAHTFVLGRCRKFEHSTAALRSCHTFIGARPLGVLCLPSSAKHASRVHALIRWVPFSHADDAHVGTFVLRVVGQNGLVVNGQRYKPMHVVRLEPGVTTLDFYGMQMAVDAPESIPRRPRTLPQSVGVSPEKLDVPSSPPRWHDVPGAGAGAGADADADADASADADADPADASDAPDTADAADGADAAASPTADMHNVPGKAQVPCADDSSISVGVSVGVGAGAGAGAVADADASPTLDAARHLVGRLALTYDLAGLLAGAIVFHRTATISASEAVRSVLSTNPSMQRGEAGACAVAFSPSKRRLVSPDASRAFPAHGEQIHGWHEGAAWSSLTRQAWHECLDQVLQSAPMFGAIQRPGKDTRGHPLECWYYYDKEHDPDKERAQNLGAFVKPMRNVVRSQKPIFWKKSEYGRATSNGTTSDDDKLPYTRNDDRRKRRAKEPSP